MNLQDIKPGVVLWNRWTYSIMGRDTDTKSTYYIVISVGEIKEKTEEGKKFNSVTCQVKGIDANSEQEVSFDEQEIKERKLRLATKKELKMLQIESVGNLEKKILEHKTKINLLEIELAEAGDKYKEFIEKAV
ncbi:MAG: hypothetical protein AABY15_06390 [Nanoarchaeota archaeon]